MNNCGVSSKIERSLRGIAGTFLLLSVFLYFNHSENWIWFIVFIAVNLLQSAFTNWCPMITFLQILEKKKAD